MKKGSKEMLRTILSNQELIMKALKIEIPVKKLEKPAKPKVVKASATKKSHPGKAKKVVGKPAVKKQIAK